jgi:phosphoribosylformylglycinamidine synthase II
MNHEPTYRTLGLTDEEYRKIVEILGRPPQPVELAMYSVMWSEHCSYKSSRVHLRRLPTTGPEVLVGPGENAGVVDVGDGIALAIRIESHNHPSAIEPYQGAATGVGGILRDIFTMGARPIALMDPLFFGPLEDPRSRYLFEGVVRGIAGYGNAVGVPTVGGSTTFDPCYRGNPLVNVLCVGLLPRDRLVLSAASGVGNLAVLLGARTGRDGIGGVSVLASAGFSADEGSQPVKDKRPNVQVGDPFEEKRLIEACLALLDEHLVVAIQDLGGAGLCCAASETAASGQVGMEIDVDAVPLRERGMSAVEVMTSESQERMLAIVAPDDLRAVQQCCERFDVLATVVGHVVPPDASGVGMLRVRHGLDGPLEAEVPAATLTTDGAPLYRRPMAEPADLAARLARDPATLVAPKDAGADLCAMLFDPEFIYRQYDHQLFGNTVMKPGRADATVLRLAAPGIPFTGRGLALSTDAGPGWCSLDPYLGTAAVVAESALNVACAGARPVALVNCCNFGNPEHPEVMWQLARSIDGMAAACEALSIPVVGGNVSLYNEHGGRDIDPTPVVGTLGLIERLTIAPPGITLADSSALVLLGTTERRLGGSRWARQIRGHRDGPPPLLDLEAHAELVRFVTDLAAASLGIDVDGLHDVSDGGLGVALAELVMASGVGCVVHGVADHIELFSESPSRVVVCTREADALLDAAARRGIAATPIGEATGRRLVVRGLVDLDVTELEAAARREWPA